MEVDSSLPSVPYNREAIYTALTAFEESDPEFQAGIQTIIGPLQTSGVPQEQIEETKKRAKVFFWSQKTGNKVNYADYKAWLASNSASSTLTANDTSNDVLAASGTKALTQAEEAEKKEDKEPYPASFDAIVELITTGKTDQIPGIRDIPLKINEEEPTQATMSRPLKPWEKVAVPPIELPEPSTQTVAPTEPDSIAAATHSESSLAS
ncbi:hypothetical protein NDA18_004479 [Ustilago nuda]|nr:hypothetical protein NDA18_004479 [Ustilago nuda]